MSKLRRMLMAIANAVSYIIDIPELQFLNTTNAVDMFSGSPFYNGSTYRVRFDYSVTVKTVYNGNMVFAIKNASAFYYYSMKSVNGRELGTFTGSVDYTVQSTNQAGQMMVVMFRPYTGLADCIVSNIKVEKVG